MRDLGRIRRLYCHEGLSLSVIARKTSYSRNTVKRWLNVARFLTVCGLGVAALISNLVISATAAYAEPTSAVVDKFEHGSLSEIGAKLTNPVSNIWALFTEFDFYFSDGNLNKGTAEFGSRMIFQPVMPLPIYGSGDKAWKLITRPNVPVFFSQPFPTGFDKFEKIGGLGDIQLPMLVSPPSGNWLLGAGPDLLLPTSTNDALGRQQWGIGPSAIFGYKTKDWISLIFPQYYFGIRSRGSDQASKPDANYLSMLYALIYNLPNAWQIGTNPTITYDDRLSRGNKWNVPVGLFVAKTTKIGSVPVKFQLGFEYSVVSQHDFGQTAQIKLNVIPVIPSLIKNPIFGGE